MYVLLSHLVRHPPTSSVAVENMRNFSFYYLVRDGSPTDNAFRCYLGLPALVAGISHSDKCSLPVPHPHLIVAMVAHYGLSHKLTAHLGMDGDTKAGECES